MKNRLKDLIKDTLQEWECDVSDNTIEQISDHLLENGVIIPPCKVGDTVFIIDEGDEGSEPYVLDVVITAYGYDISGFWATLNLPLGLKMSAHFGERMFGKSVFLTREEAEKALAESEEVK